MKRNRRAVVNCTGNFLAGSDGRRKDPGWPGDQDASVFAFERRGETGGNGRRDDAGSANYRTGTEGLLRKRGGVSGRRSLSIGMKILGGFIFLLILVVFMSGIGLFTLSKVESSGRLIEKANELRSGIHKSFRLADEFVHNPTDDAYAEIERFFEDIHKITLGLEAFGGQSQTVRAVSKNGRRYIESVRLMRELHQRNEALVTSLQNGSARLSENAFEISKATSAEIEESILAAVSVGLKQQSAERTRSVVDMGWSVLNYYHRLSDDYRDEALEVVRNLRFGNGNYFYVLDTDVIVMAHGMDRNIEGIDYSVIGDKKTGIKFVKHLVTAAIQNGESQADYFWTKPGHPTDRLFPKISHARYFEPWGLVICAGIYVDDLEAEIARQNEALSARLKTLHDAFMMNEHSMRARIEALYYVAFGKSPEGVAAELNRLKALAGDNAALRHEADAYVENFFSFYQNNEKLRARIGEIDTVSDQAAEIVQKAADDAATSFHRTSVWGRYSLASLAVACMLIGVALALGLTRSITRPVNLAIGGLNDISGQVAAAASQISASGQFLSQSTAQQAASVEETSATLEELSAMTSQNAQNARQADELMRKAGAVVDQAGHAMRDLTGLMGRISQSGEKTTDIVKSIDEIAFQTNLLALNAAIEAARAGDAGVGFAVVADEVRRLALRATEASAHTGRLIEEMLKEVRQGDLLAEKNNAAFGAASSDTGSAVELVMEIARASEEQARGISEINTAVAEMDKLSQQNAANVEESAAASEEMNGQADQMRAFVRDLLELVHGRGEVSAKKSHRTEIRRDIT